MPRSAKPSKTKKKAPKDDRPVRLDPFAQVVAQRVEKYGFSGNQIARMAGMHHSQYYAWLKGKRSISLDRLLKVMHLVGIGLRYTEPHRDLTVRVNKD